MQTRFCGYTVDEVLEMGAMWDELKGVVDTPEFKAIIAFARVNKLRREIADREAEIKELEPVAAKAMVIGE